MKLRAFIIAVAIVATAFPLSAQSQSKPDPFAPIRFLVGHWQGTSAGQPGQGKGERTYEFVLRGGYIRGTNKTIYPPQEKNPKGETHEDIGIFSYDKQRKRLVLRQFHVEGFINTYVQDDGSNLSFTTEAIENIPAGWRARESYQIISKDEFIERFELAEPGKDFEPYSESRWKRIR